MIRQILNIRENLRKLFVDLKNTKELDSVLDKTGKIIKINELSRLNTQNNDATFIETFRSFNESPGKQRQTLRTERMVTIGIIREKST